MADDLYGGIWRLTKAEFVGQPIVARSFEITGEEDDWEPVWRATEDASAPALWASADDQFRIRNLDWSDKPALALYAGEKPSDRPVGFYVPPMLFVEPAYRNKGLGTMMILAAAQQFGNPLLESVDGVGFSERGLEAHLRAHRMAVDRALEMGYPVPEAVLEGYGLEPEPPAM